MFSDLVFEYLPTGLLGAIAAMVSIAYFLRADKRLRPRGFRSNAYKFIFYTRSWTWAVFAFSFFIFPYISLASGRALLRLSLAILVVTEAAFHIAYFWEFIRERLKLWTHN